MAVTLGPPRAAAMRWGLLPTPPPGPAEAPSRWLPLLSCTPSHWPPQPPRRFSQQTFLLCTMAPASRRAHTHEFSFNLTSILFWQKSLAHIVQDTLLASLLSEHTVSDVYLHHSFSDQLDQDSGPHQKLEVSLKGLAQPSAHSLY